MIPRRTDEKAAGRGARGDAPRTRSARPRPASTAPGWPTPTRWRPALEAFDAVLGDRPNQIDEQREDVRVSAADLLAIGDTPGEITEDGPALQRERGHPVHLVVAARQRRRGHLRADGGRGHGRDLPLADLAVGPPRRASSRTAAR
ncbi:MAG: hypothetical protein WKF40_00790 [Thermoleophilaceae bacterium]